MDKHRLLTYFRGRVALREALEAVGVGRGDQVAIQAFTCLAVPLPIISIGAIPVYVDINQDDLGMNVSDLKEKVGPLTRAIVVQHTFGIPADVQGVLEVAARLAIPVIEDCCHVLDATVAGQEVGSFGTASFYSFEWGKPIVVGLGGGLRVNDRDLFSTLQARHSRLRRPPLKQRVMVEVQYWAYRTLLNRRTYWTLRQIYKHFSNIGLLVGTFRREDLRGVPHDEYTWTMAPLCEARLHKHLRGFDDIVKHHCSIVDQYEKGVHELGLGTWEVPNGRQHVYLRYPLRCKDKKAVLRAAQAQKVEISAIFQTPVHPVECKEAGLFGYIEGSCPVAEELCRTLVSLPIGCHVQSCDINRTLEFLSSIRGCLQSAE